MNLNELKKSMSTLDDVLAKNSSDTINLNTATCNTAQKKILKTYRRATISCTILAVVNIIACTAGIVEDAFPRAYKLFLGIFMAVAALWYAWLYFKVKKINVAISTPIQIMKQVASLRFCALTGEIACSVVLAVFLTLYLSNLWVVEQHTFWIVIAAMVMSVALLITVYLPKTIRDFKNLTALN